MTTPLTPNDWEALSAYLDDQLGEAARAKVETRLDHDLELREALAELQQVRTVLRNTPQLRVPRNFTLTPEMAGISERPRRAYPFFRLVFAMASILFAFTFFGDVSGLLSPTISTPMQVSLSADAISEAEFDAADETADTNEAPEAVAVQVESEVMEEPLAKISDGGMSDSAAPLEGARAMGESAELEGDDIMPAPPQALLVEESAPVETEAAAAEPMAESFSFDETAADSATAEDEDCKIEEPVCDVPLYDPEVSPEQFAESLDEVAVPMLTQTVPESGPNPLRIAQVILAVIAIVSGGAMWFLRRSS